MPHLLLLNVPDMNFFKTLLAGFCLVLLCSNPVKAQVNITYVVDVSLYLDSGNVLDTAGMRIGGRFSSMGINNIPDWTPSALPCKMTPVGFNKWSITIHYPDSAKGKAQDFKFVNGNWGVGKDERSAGLAGCGYISGGIVNRRVIIPNHDSTFRYCWNSCNTCPVQFAVMTGTASSITGSSAQVTGNITGTGILEQGICYGTNPNPTVINSYTYSDPGSGNGPFSASLSMLNPGTQYYFRAFARRSSGYTYGSIGTFTTLAPGQFISVTYKVNISNLLGSGVTIVDPSGIRIAGDFARRGAKNAGAALPDWNPADNSCAMENLGNNTWSITLQYPDSSLGKVQKFIFVNGTLASAETSDSLLSGGCALLDAGNIRRKIQLPFNSETVEYCWDRCAAACLALPPAISNSQTGAITFHSAGLSAKANGTGISMRGFCFSQISNPDTSQQKVLSGSGAGEFSVLLENLQPGTLYHARAFALNPQGLSYGEELTFSTSQAISVNYLVNVAEYIQAGNVIGPNGIRIGGNFADMGAALPNWTPSSPLCAMEPMGPDVWKITVFYPDSAAGKTQRFKFVNNDWGTNEGSQTLVSSGCGVQDGNDVNRIIILPVADGNFCYLWDKCNTCEVAVDEATAVSEEKVWPNPFSSELELQVAYPKEVRILSLLGKTEWKSLMTKGRQKINLSHLKSGLYILQYSDGKSIPLVKK